MGHTEHAEAGADRREPVASPFRSVEEVWAFDPVAEYGMPSFDEQVAAYEELDRKARREFPRQLTTGGYYKTIVSGAIQAFGWDMFLQAAARTPRKWRRCLTASSSAPSSTCAHGQGHPPRS